MLIPAIALFGIEVLGLMPRRYAYKLALQLSLFALELYISFPLSSAYFPAIARINADEFKNESPEVQEKLSNYRNSAGQPIPYFQYNKGL